MGHHHRTDREGLLGLPQPEGQIDEWQRAWDELTDVRLEGEPEGWETDAATAIQRKRPDAWAVHWGKRNLIILEFTGPNDRCATALQDTDAYKRDRYTPRCRTGSLGILRAGSWEYLRSQ
jgi:hypothetical protein